MLIIVFSLLFAVIPCVILRRQEVYSIFIQINKFSIPANSIAQFLFLAWNLELNVEMKLSINSEQLGFSF
jgi:hypothetical protein